MIRALCLSKLPCSVPSVRAKPPMPQGILNIYIYGYIYRPVALLLLSLHRAACAIDTNYTIHAYNEPSLPIIHTPHQHTKQLFLDLGTRARTKAAAHKRTEYTGLHEIDTTVYHNATAKLTDEERHIVNNIAMGGMWCASKLHELGHADSPACQHCGAEQQTVNHILWHCPALAHARCTEHHNTEHIQPDDLPPALQIGVPPAMGTSSEYTYWGGEVNHDWTLKTQAAYGAYQLQHKFKLAWDLVRTTWSKAPHNATYTHPPLRYDRHTTNARQHFASLQEHRQHRLQLPALPRCEQPAPPTINVYTDGSRTIPTDDRWGLGAFGVWERERTIDNEPLNDIEDNHLVAENYKDGLAISGILTGMNNSSTRTEICGGIGALLANKPRHIGADNKAFTQMANRIIKGENITRKKQWPLHKDGDLWEVFEKAVKERGHKSVKATWVKGHATEAHIAKGITTDEHRIGNNNADHAASKIGQRIHTDSNHQLAGVQQARTANYTKLVKDIHHMFIRVCQEEKKLREQKKKSLTTAFTTNAKPTITAPTALQYGTNKNDTNINITLHDLPKVHPQLQHDATAYAQTWAFLTTIKGQTAGEEQPGITWIEMAALFVIRGGNHNPEQPLIRPTVANFKRTVKMVIADLGNDSAKAAFTPAKNAKPRLKAIGITNHQQAINFLPHTTEEEAQQITKYLLGHKMHITHKVSEALKEGILKVKVAKHNFKGPADWDNQFTITEYIQSKLQEWKQKYTEDQQEQTSVDKHPPGDQTGAKEAEASLVVAATMMQPEHGGQESGALPRSRDSMIPGTTGNNVHNNTLRCTQCGNTKKVKPSQLCGPKGWGTIRCKVQQCHHKAKAHKWPCSCGKMWTNCEHHDTTDQPLQNTTATTSVVPALTPLSIYPPPKRQRLQHRQTNDQPPAPLQHITNLSQPTCKRRRTEGSHQRQKATKEAVTAKAANEEKLAKRERSSTEDALEADDHTERPKQVFKIATQPDRPISVFSSFQVGEADTTCEVPARGSNEDLPAEQPEMRPVTTQADEQRHWPSVPGRIRRVSAHQDCDDREPKRHRGIERTTPDLLDQPASSSSSCPQGAVINTTPPTNPPILVNMHAAIATSVYVQEYLKRQARRPVVRETPKHKRCKVDKEALKAVELFKDAKRNPYSKEAIFPDPLPGSLTGKLSAFSIPRFSPGGSCTADPDPS